MQEPGAVCRLIGRATPPHQQVPQLKDSTIRKDETHGDAQAGGVVSEGSQRSGKNGGMALIQRREG